MRSRAVILPDCVLPFDARLSAAFAQARLERLNLFDKVAHVRLAGDVHVISVWRNRPGP